MQTFAFSVQIHSICHDLSSESCCFRRRKAISSCYRRIAFLLKFCPTHPTLQGVPTVPVERMQGIKKAVSEQKPPFCIWFTYKVYCYFLRYFKKSSIPMTSTLGKDIFSNSLKCLSSDTIKIALLAIAQSTNLLSSSSAFINPKL